MDDFSLIPHAPAHTCTHTLTHIPEAQLELEIAHSELSGGVDSADATKSMQYKQLEAQNARLKEVQTCIVLLVLFDLMTKVSTHETIYFHSNSSCTMRIPSPISVHGRLL